MALQVALSQLRHSKETTVKKKDENQRLESRKPRTSTSTATVSLFSVDEAELFNFSDEDFLPNDNPFPLPPQSSTTTSASTCTNTTTAINSERGSTSVAGHECGSNPSLITGAPSHETATNRKLSRSSQSDSECSPSTKTLEKLRSFKFVKTSNLKSRSVHAKRPLTIDDQLELTPPPNKKRSISNEDTRCDTSSDSLTRRGTVSGTNSGLIFKQPSFNPRTSFNNLTSTPTSSQSEGQSSSLGANVTPTAHQRHTLEARGAHSRTNFTASQPNHYQSNSSGPATGLPSTPIPSTSIAHTSTSGHGGILSTPQHTPNSAQSSARLTTPQRAIANTVMQTPKRARQTTPLVCTPTGNEIGTPIARASVPLKRKFPGPAGLLPSLAPGQSMDNIYIPPPSTPTPASTPREKRFGLSATPTTVSIPPHCVPEDVAMFTSSPWTDMMADLDLNSTSAQSTALLQYNIASALKQASNKQLRNGKVVHLRAVIKSIIPAGKNASALLKDPTGEVMCTIHSKVIEDHQKELHPGAVLVLRQISVFSPSPRKHYFNITPSNIIRIYSTNSTEKTSQAPLSLSDILGAEDSGDNTSGYSQCSSSLKEFNPTGLTNLNNNRILSQSRQEREMLHSSQQRMTNVSLPSSSRTNSAVRSGNLQSLTIGAASFLAARKLSSHSNSSANHSDGSITTKTPERVASSNNASEALLDDLPCDFDDFSDDENDGNIICMDTGNVQKLLHDGDNPAPSASTTHEEMDTSDGIGTSSVGRDDKIAPKESSFFNKLCEDEFDSLFNDIADDGLDF